MNTPTEQEVLNMIGGLSNDHSKAKRIARWYVIQVAAKDERIRELERAFTTILYNRDSLDINGLQALAQATLKTKE